MSSLTANQQAYDAIRAAVVNGTLSGDMRLTETDLALQLDMSRTPVREAIKRLILEGMLSRSPKRGLRVASLSAADVEEIFEIRLLLEPYVARRAAIEASEQQRKELMRQALQMQDIYRQGGPSMMADLTEANISFHKLLLASTDAPRVEKMLTDVIDLALIARTFRTYEVVDIERSLSHHVEIATAINARAPEWAAHVMSSHLLAASRIMRGGEL